jgi:site-specific DNA-methyltransferase (adenine-specific)
VPQPRDKKIEEAGCKRMKLYHGDCLELMKEIPDGSIDMILCDLPYGITACKWDVIIPFEPLWEQYERIIKNNSAIVLFGTQPFTSALVMSNPKMFKHQWIWNKKQSGSAINAKYKPLKITEEICVFAKGRVNYYPIMRKGKMRKKGGNKKSNALMNDIPDYHTYSEEYYPTCILEISNANRKNRLHPTQKPIALLEYLVRTYTNEGETVLDNCMGSGSTGIACMNTNRRFIGIEKEKKYFDIATKRIEEHQQQLRLL